jgi:type I restriction enzyme S subunit
VKAVKCTTIGEVCAFLNGGTPSRSIERYFQGDIPWITGADIISPVVTTARSFITDEAVKSSATNRVPAGTVLLVTRTSVGKVATAGVELCFSQDITALTPDSSCLHTPYLVEFLKTQETHFERQARGATIKGITRQVVADLEISLPPLPEQRRIAQVLEKAEALRVKRRAAIAELDSLTQFLFLDLFGDPSANAKGFPKKTLALLVREDDTINYGVVQPGDDLDEGVPLVRVGDLIEGEVRHSELKRIAPSIEAAYKRSRLRGDEILVSCVGSIGVVALANETVKGFNIARAVARIPLAETTNRLFMAAYLRSDFVQRYFTSELRTVSQPTLNIKQISETTVILPPIELQNEFARRATVVEKLKTAQRASLAELDALFATLQHRAFRGEL